jgi:hypothetical protein
LFGWTIFTIVVFIFNAIVYHDTSSAFLPFGVSILVLGLVISHLLKKAIQKFRILKKPFASQVVLLLVLTIIFSIAGNLGWMLVMIAAGLWKIEGNTLDAWIADFWEEYLFNLPVLLFMFSAWVLIYFLFHYGALLEKKAAEQLKSKYEKDFLELEARSLRAQMNPHFIFNCLNSIKALMQEKEIDKGVIYLTTFSKLIRTLFHNADKKEITLYDEIETCKLYLQLEAMRFDEKFSFTVNVDPDMDLKSIYVPALIVQPFVENSIWHGIIPKQTGGYVNLLVTQNDNAVEVVIDDDGIGRGASKQNKAKNRVTHQSKGVNLTQSRLELDGILQQRKLELQAIDKHDEFGNAIGTKVILKIEEKE